MHPSSADTQLNDRLRKLETLLPEIERLPDAALRESVREIVQTLLDFHGEAVSRIMQGLADAGEPGRKLFAELRARRTGRQHAAALRPAPDGSSRPGAGGLERVRPAWALTAATSCCWASATRAKCICGSRATATVREFAGDAQIHDRAGHLCGGADVASIRVEGVVEAPPAGGFVPLGELTAAARTTPRLTSEVSVNQESRR